MALQTATVKPGAEEAADAELRFCFRVVSPARSYVLQAADDLEAVEWMECIHVSCVLGLPQPAACWSNNMHSCHVLETHILTAEIRLLCNLKTSVGG